MSDRRRIAAAVLAMLSMSNAGADAGWFEAPEVTARLASGEIVVAESPSAGTQRGRVRAAVRIAADPEAIWKVMTNCARAPEFVPNLRHCEVLEAAADGSWEVLRHEVKYLWLWPRLHYVFRADYRRPERVDFRHVSGDFKEQEGSWILRRLPDTAHTIVGYEVYLDPGFRVPQSIVRRALAKDLPALLSALRNRVQSEP